MDVRRITTSEIIAAVGGVLLALSVFLPWYKTDPDNPNANVDAMTGNISAWDAHSILRYLLLAAALAPIILLYIVVRDHELSWPRGEMTAVIGIIAFGLVGLQRHHRPARRAAERDHARLRLVDRHAGHDPDHDRRLLPSLDHRTSAQATRSHVDAPA